MIFKRSRHFKLQSDPKQIELQTSNIRIVDIFGRFDIRTEHTGRTLFRKILVHI